MLEEVTLASAEGGSFRLRHTFALRQLRCGFDEPTVKQWLGVELNVMKRYRRVISAPIDVA